MKTLSIAALLATSLAAVGLAGCQTVEDPGYGYYESDYDAYEVPTATYRSDVYIGGGYVERRMPRVAWERDRPPPPRYSPPPRWEHAPPPPRFEPRPPPRFEPRPPPPPHFQPPPHRPGPPPPPSGNPPPRGDRHGPRPPWLPPER